MINITNDGPTITATDYWQSEYAARDLMILSPNAGHIRVLMPDHHHPVLEEFAACDYAILTRGTWMGKESVEILWEDHTDTPHMWHLTEDTCLMLPGDPSPAEWTISLWVERDGQPYCALARPCRWRRAEALPCGKPWSN